MNSFEKIKSSFCGKEKFIQANEVVAYGVKENLIHIHVVPEKKIEKIISKFRDGLREIANVVSDNEKIEKITSTSWLVAQYPEVLEKRYGFIVDGKISEEMKSRHFADEKREVWEAHMDREDFLNKYFHDNLK